MDSSKINVLRASLGSTVISDMQNAYYTSGLSLAELRERYDLPSDFSDPDFISLFGLFEIDKICPVCFGHLYAPHVSRGIIGAGPTSYDKSRVFCVSCHLNSAQIEREAAYLEKEGELSQIFSSEPLTFDWGKFDPDNRQHITFAFLFACCLNGGSFIGPINLDYGYDGFYKDIHSLVKAGYLVPSWLSKKDVDQYSLRDNGSVSCNLMCVPFEVDVKGPLPTVYAEIYIRDGREAIVLGKGEIDHWQAIDEWLVGSYLDYELWDWDDDCSEGKRSEFDELVPQLLGHFSPAQITSLIWGALATALKKAQDGTDGQKTASYAVGVVINRCKRALADEWDVNPNKPLIDVDYGLFEDYFFSHNVPIGKSWVYRPLPKIQDGVAILEWPTFPKFEDEVDDFLLDRAQSVFDSSGKEAVDLKSYRSVSNYVHDLFREDTALR